MFYLIKHIDASYEDGPVSSQTDIVWQYENEMDAQDAADLYNTNLALAGVPSWTCFYTVVS